MKLTEYIRDRSIWIICLLLAGLLISCLLLALRLSVQGIVLVNVILGAFVLSAGVIDFMRRKKFYDQLFAQLEGLDHKYLLAELADEPGFAEGELMCRILRACNKSMADEVGLYRNRSREYREYIEQWVHEIKTPIACAALIYENNKTPATQSMFEELVHIENYVEQSLYYARSNYVEKDYAIQACDLQQTVLNALKQHAKQLIEHKTAVELNVPETTVYTDAKWVQFILGQLVLNALKYQAEQRPLKLTFFAEKKPQQIDLHIRDNGCGIPEQDVPRVFEQGFTGENGRRFAKSTGMGLFICKQLCNKLGLGIALTAAPEQGTEVVLTFPVGKLHTLEE